MQSSDAIDALEMQAALNEFKSAVERLNGGAAVKPIPEAVQRRLFGLFERVVKGEPPNDSTLAGDERANAWGETRGMSKLAAMNEYVDLCDEYVPDQSKPIESLPESIRDQVEQRLGGASACTRSEQSETSNNVWEAVRAGTGFEVFFPEHLNARDDVCGATPLMIAADAEQANALNAILAYPDVLVNAVDEDGCTALHYAATIGNAEITKALLDAGADAGIQDAEGMDVRGTAADARSNDVVAVLDAHQRMS